MNIVKFIIDSINSRFVWKGNRIIKKIFMLVICLFITFISTNAFCAGPRDDGPYLFGNFGFASWGDSRVEGGEHSGRSMNSNRGTVIGGYLDFKITDPLLHPLWAEESGFQN